MRDVDWQQLFIVSCNTRAVEKQIKFSGNAVSYSVQLKQETPYHNKLLRLNTKNSRKNNGKKCY